jgi:recombination protein RecR
MLTLPSALTELIHRLARMPGVGPRSAERIAIGLLKWDSAELEALADGLRGIVGRVTPCPICAALSQDGQPCSVCADPYRTGAVICVVEGPLDAIAIERGGVFTGRYHVLGGALSPLRGVMPEDLRFAELLKRIKAEGTQEVIIATNASPDGEATALYIRQELEGLPAGRTHGAGKPDDHAAANDPAAAGGGADLPPLRVTRLARGLPSGAQLDYADAATLQSALENRTSF